jgi:hypothetical protein
MPVSYYVTLRRGRHTAWLAGPFRTSAEARAAENHAVSLAHRLDPFTQFDAHGVSWLDSGLLPVGRLNDALDLVRVDGGLWRTLPAARP